MSLPYRHGSVSLLNTLHPQLPVLPGGLSLEWCLWFCAMTLGASSTYSARFLPDTTLTQTHSHHLLLAFGPWFLSFSGMPLSIPLSQKQKCLFKDRYAWERTIKMTPLFLGTFTVGLLALFPIPPN